MWFTASAMIDDMRRERNLPRSRGMMQKQQVWSQPLAILMEADPRGVVWASAFLEYRNACSYGAVKRKKSEDK
jgi:hypothetical protein